VDSDSFRNDSGCHHSALDGALGRAISYAQAAPVGQLGRAAVIRLPTAKNRGRIVRMTFYEVLEQVIAMTPP
jgi:hypothetical protein